MLASKFDYVEGSYLLLRTAYALLTESHLFCVVLLDTYICNNHGNLIRTFILNGLTEIQ
jgi:hypothetical protein